MEMGFYVRIFGYRCAHKKFIDFENGVCGVH